MLQRVSSKTSASTVSFYDWFQVETEDNLFRQTWRSSCIGGSSYSVMIRELFLSCFELPVNYVHVSGIAGGVVSQPFFQQHFGLTNPDGSKNVKRTNDVSSIVVSVLQGGAFFGALGSAPISGASRLSSSSTSTYQIITGKFGRKWTLVAFTAIFSVGAILTTVANEPHNGLALIYAGRVISGFGIGGISAVAPAFVSECSPKDVRGRITGLFQIMVRHIALSFLSCSDLCRRLPSVS